MQHSSPNGQVFLVSAARTPIGKFGGALSTTPAVELGGVAIRAAVERAGLPDGTAIDEVLMGQVIQAGAGLKAIMLAAAEIKAGDAEVAVAGGMENMNLAPYLLPNARFGYRLGDGALVDSTVH